MKTRSDLIKYIQSNYSEFQISEFSQVVILSAFPLEYERFLEFQEIATKYVKETNDKLFICCNHSTLATNGRGDRQNTELLNESHIDSSIPVYEIKRGGGLTLHHMGQWIFYPIVKLNPTSWPLTHHMCWMIDNVKFILQSWGVKVIGKRKPLGVWYKDESDNYMKVASIGVGVNRFVSNHGLALNLKEHGLDQKIFSLLNPCGLNSSIYSSIEQISGQNITVEDFNKRFIQLIDQRVQADQLQLLTEKDCLLD